tara:strand:- start:1905 stop:3182 length:1278 start_codon:yes stop_codon:yes gene_type:complete
MHELNNKFKNKKILIYGYGKSGISSFKYLKKNNDVFIFDDKKKIKNSYFISFKNLKKKVFDYILVSPGIDLKKCGLKKYLFKFKKKIITDLDIFYCENINNLKIAITGTNGKSTTTELLFRILKSHRMDVRMLGNIGKPMLGEKNIKPSTLFVIEVSSYQIDYSKYFNADHTIILNLTPDHLERHGSIYKYAHAKFKLILNQDNKSYAYIEENNKYLNSELRKYKVKSKIIKVKKNNIKSIKKKIYNPYFRTINNLHNLSFIIELGKKIKLNKKIILKTVNSFNGLIYRQQIILNKKKITIINDSKSTSFSSSLNLLKTYKNIFWIVGGLAKKGDRFLLPKRYYKNINCYIYGTNKSFFINVFKKKLKFQLFDKLSQIVKKIKIDSIYKENINIIFSPAAASFDQFSNFEHRGRYFNSLIKKYKF